MEVNPPTFMLKAIWVTHFVLSSWALLSGFLAVSTYWYTHVGVLAFGYWAIVSKESTDAIIMFLVTLIFSILNDILLLALYEPRHNFYVPNSHIDEYRFALGMCITNLIIKPLSAFFLYRIYQSRASGSDFSTGIPVLDSSKLGRNPGTYANIDDGQTNNEYRRPSEPPQYQAPTYQEPPPMGPSYTGNM